MAAWSCPVVVSESDAEVVMSALCAIDAHELTRQNYAEWSRKVEWENKLTVDGVPIAECDSDVRWDVFRGFRRLIGFKWVWGNVAPAW
jgi:hypothetical protein